MKAAGFCLVGLPPAGTRQGLGHGMLRQGLDRCRFPEEWLSASS